MEAYLNEWMSLIIRWFHVIAGVAWIGASFYFVWLDNHLRNPPEWKTRKGIKGDLWAIHGGGFYEVAKYRLGPEEMPPVLHWFKWEAYATWISGMAMLSVVYYLGSPGYLIDPAKADLSHSEAIAISLAFIAAALAVYEGLLRSPLWRNGLAFGVILYLFLVAITWGLFQVLAGRGAFMHVGAVIGTIMVGNVFLGIIPAQRALVDAVERGETPGPHVAELAEKAKLRSTHNNYLTLPVILIMISNHYPMLYGGKWGWAILAALGFITAFARHFFNLRHKGISRPWILLVAALLTLALAWAMVPARTPVQGNSAEVGGTTVTDAEIETLLASHCQTCHSDIPTHPAFSAAPAGISLDSLAALEQHASNVHQAAVATHYMPLGNATGMTQAEREALGRWLQENAPQ